MTEWKTMESVPEKEVVLLFNKNTKTMWLGRKRYGFYREPNQDLHVWRCESSGLFLTPTHWAKKPNEPTLAKWEEVQG